MKNNIHFESLSPNLIVADVNRSVEYYKENLGFSLIASVPENGNFNWAMVIRDGVTVMFQSLKSLQEDLPELKANAKGGLSIFYIKVKGLDDLFGSVRKSDIAVAMRTTFYGAREFAIKDPDGYFLMFAEDVN